MKTMFFLTMPLALTALIFFEAADAQPTPPVPGCDAAKRCTSPQLAKVCSAVPAVTPYYKEKVVKLFNLRRIRTNGVPNHKIGLFPLNDDRCGCGRPNALAAHDAFYSMQAETGPRGTTVKWLHLPDKYGVAVNGVVFDPLADEWWNDDDASGWQKNALLHPDMVTDLDCNMAHIQGDDGAYHYHALPTGLYELLGGKYPWTDEAPPKRSTIVQLGWGFDGTPLYGPLCAEPDSLGPGKYNWRKPKSGWILKSGTRSSGPGRKYNGDYDQDFEYVSHGADPGYLDQVNGHLAPTPDQPQGVYHQHITEEFPYIPRGFLDVAAAPAAKSIATGEVTSDKHKSYFKAYPSPAKDILHIELSGKAIVSLTDAAGKVMLRKTIESKGEAHISGLPSGLYYLKNTATGEVQKVVIAK